MLKKQITYTDFNGEEHTEDFYFNLTKAELIDMELSGPDNSFRKSMQKIIDSNNGRVIMQEFKRLINRAFGIRSDDGKRFIKSEEISREFESTGAYNELFIELTTNADAASAWVRGVMPEASTTQVETTGKTPSQIARERSEAQMQGHREKTPVTQQAEPVLPTSNTESEETAPIDTSDGSEPMTLDEINNLEIPDNAKAQLRILNGYV